MRDLVSEIETDINATSLYDYLCAVLKAVNRIVNTDKVDGFTARATAIKTQGDKLGDLLFEIENS